VGSNGCTYNNNHSRRKYCPLVRRRGCEGNERREAVADGGGSRKAELRAASSGILVATCHFSHVPSCGLYRDRSCCATNTSSQSHISVFRLCDGQLGSHIYIWLCSTGYNEFASRYGNTMPASNPLRIPSSTQRTATVIFLHVNHSLIDTLRISSC